MNGRIVKRTGDGSIIEFRSMVDAVCCAIEVQTGLIERIVAPGARALAKHKHRTHPRYTCRMNSIVPSPCVMRAPPHSSSDRVSAFPRGRRLGLNQWDARRFVWPVHLRGLDREAA